MLDQLIDLADRITICPEDLRMCTLRVSNKAKAQICQLIGPVGVTRRFGADEVLLVRVSDFPDFSDIVLKIVSAAPQAGEGFMFDIRGFKESIGLLRSRLLW